MIDHRPLGRTGLRVSELGMGCSRLGALLASAGPGEAERAVEVALGCGITLFDTADSYAQGDSERVLGRVLRRCGADVVVATKAGFVLPAPRWVLRLAKPPLRLLAHASRGVDRSLTAWRGHGYPQRFDVGHLRRALRGSLRRLQRDHVDVFLLHNPPVALARSEALWRWVEDETRAGHMRAFGVSCLGTDAEVAWLFQPAVGVVQIPWRTPPGSSGDAFLGHARRRCVGIVARELLGGPAARTEPAIRTALGAVLAHGEVSAALLGMTQPAHVHANAGLMRDIAAAEPALPARA